MKEHSLADNLSAINELFIKMTLKTHDQPRCLAELERGIVVAKFSANDMAILQREAARVGFIQLVKLLIEKGVDINSKSDAGQGGSALLSSVCLHSNFSCVELLISKGADLESRDFSSCEGATVLIRAATQGNSRYVELFLKHGARTESKDFFGQTALISAAARGDLRSVQLLLAADANIEAQDEKGMTPLMHAVIKDHTDCVSYLLEYGGASPETADEFGDTALDYSVRYKRIFSMSLLSKQLPPLEEAEGGLEEDGFDMDDLLSTSPFGVADGYIHNAAGAGIDEDCGDWCI